MMAHLRTEISNHRRPLAVLALVIVALASIPYLEVYFTTRDVWRGIPPTFSDDLYFAKVLSIAEGHVTAGNPYFLERSDGPPLVIFGGAWLNAITFALFPLIPAQTINFIIWSFLYAAAAYTLLRLLRAPPPLAVFGTAFLYLESWFHVWRPANLQPVYPFYFLFYIALLLLIREQSRRNIILLGVAIGAFFYLYAFLWQTAVITVGLLILFALIRRNWNLFKGALTSLAIGGAIGLPIPLYILWLSRSSPYFWESMNRLGLVESHIPMGVVMHIGGWVGFVLLFIAVLYWRLPWLRQHREFILICTYLAISGLGLWIMQGSNLITGKQLETGEHISGFIYLWLTTAGVILVAFLSRQSASLKAGQRVFVVLVLTVLWLVNVSFVNLFGIAAPQHDSKLWREMQNYAGPVEWFNREVQEPAVIWSHPHNYLSTLLPIYTKHFVLYANWGMFELVPDSEVRERYLVSQYFTDPTAADLASTTEMFNYLGRKAAAHEAKTIERSIKVCRMIFFWDKDRVCKEVPTPQGLLGEAFFADLERIFRTDIKPNIKTYLEKYHVSYILKDKKLDPRYEPQKLGATKVFEDARYEIWSF